MMTLRIREEAHRRLGTSARRSPWRVLATAAVVVLCVSHLGWTMAFLGRIYGP